jgi:tetratricopeptide (TPR) repeat protein
MRTMLKAMPCASRCGAQRQRSVSTMLAVTVHHRAWQETSRSESALCCLQKDFHGAIRCYSKALQLVPNHFKALFNRGFSYDKLERLDDAIQDYTAALAIDASNSYAYYNRGITRDRAQDYRGAIADFTTAISLEPDNADFYHNRGFSLRKQVGFWSWSDDPSRAHEVT